MGESRRMEKPQRMSTRRTKNVKKVDLSDLIKSEREQHNKMNTEFSWPDLCKRIPKCVLYCVNELRQFAIEGLGHCSCNAVDQFLMFIFELLVSESALTNEKFAVLKQRAENLTFDNAQAMFKLIVTIRKKFSESVARSLNNNNNKSANNLFGLKFEYQSAIVSDSETSRHIVPLEDTNGAGYSSLEYGYEETKPRTIRAQFDKAEYEEMLNEHYEKYSPNISRQAFKNTIIDSLRSENSESELIDFLGFEAMEFLQYIIENRECIAGLNSDFISLQKNIVIEKLGTQSEEGIQLWKDMEKIERKLVSDERQKVKHMMNRFMNRIEFI